MSCSECVHCYMYPLTRSAARVPAFSCARSNSDLQWTQIGAFFFDSFISCSPLKRYYIVVPLSPPGCVRSFVSLNQLEEVRSRKIREIQLKHVRFRRSRLKSRLPCMHAMPMTNIACERMCARMNVCASPSSDLKYQSSQGTRFFEGVSSLAL